MTIDVVPAADAGWDAVEAVLLGEATSRDCWCQFHLLANAAWKQTNRQARHDLLREQVVALDPPRGLIALVDGQPAGWCGVEPRQRLRHVLSSALVTKSSPFALDDPGTWSVYCLLVPGSHRGRGVAQEMLAAAVRHARARGATGIEGYPMDAAVRAGRGMSGFSTGTVSMFDREGFRAVSALPSGRTLMVREAENSDSSS